MTVTSLETVYERGWNAARDVQRVKPNMVLVRGVRRPESHGAIAIPATASVRDGAPWMFRVEATGEVREGSWGPNDVGMQNVAVGDIVIPRHANLDPLSDGDDPLFALDVRDVLAVVRKECAESSA